MRINLTDINGATLKTAGTYCKDDISVVPVLQTKTVTVNGEVVADEGFAGLQKIIVNVASMDNVYDGSYTTILAQSYTVEPNEYGETVTILSHETVANDSGTTVIFT